MRQTDRLIAASLSAARIPASVVIFVLLVSLEQRTLLPCLLIALGIEISDVLDGYWARRRGVAATSGRILDSFSDHMSRTLVLAGLASQSLVPIWLVGLALLRNGIVDLSRALTGHGVPTAPRRMLGKGKGAAEGVLIVSTLALAAFWEASPHPAVFVTVAALQSLSTLLEMPHLVRAITAASPDVQCDECRLKRTACSAPR